MIRLNSIWMAVVLLLLGSVSVKAQEILTLKQAVALAMENSPNLEAAEQRLAAAEAAIEQARSGYYPQISIHERYTRTDYPPMAFSSVMARRELRFDPSVDFNHPNREDLFNTELRLLIPLYQGGLTQAHVRAARSSREATEADYEEIQNELIYRVVESYFLTLNAQDMASVQEDSVQLVESQLQLVKARYEEGAVVYSDLLNMEVRLAEERQSLITARNRVELSFAALYHAMGLPHPEELPILDLTCQLEPVDAALPDAIAQAVETRPALQAMTQRAEALTARIRAARSETLPKVNAFGHFYLDSEKLRDFEDGWMIGASVDLTLFNGFRTAAEIRQIRAQLAEVEAVRNELMQGIELQVRQAYLRAEEAKQRMPIAARSVVQAEESERVVRNRYEAGAALVTELLDAELALRRARLAQVDARYHHEIALAALRKAQGALIQEYRQQIAQ